MGINDGIDGVVDLGDDKLHGGLHPGYLCFQFYLATRTLFFFSLSSLYYHQNTLTWIGAGMVKPTLSHPYPYPYPYRPDVFS